ncbi:MAG: prolyl oligopeptidase family serine peptidase [Chitinophagaceae bacterium]|nr:prolyl oligopeptidase family serine peptidase [Chitinophagaceae bacterium]
MNSKLSVSLIVFFAVSFANAQSKKPLDHSVYDGWQSIGERKISNDSKWVVYSIDVQEGDNELVIQSTDVKYKRIIPRGYNAMITEDSRYAVFKIKPLYKDTRQARIKKRKPEDFPKDSFAIVELGKDSIMKVARVKSYKIPEKASGWVAYHLEKPLQDTSKRFEKMDSVMKTIDSVKKVLPAPGLKEPDPKKKKKRMQPPAKEDEWFDEENEEWITDAEGDEAGTAKTEEGTELVIINLETGEKQVLKHVSEYYWSKTGNILLTEGTSIRTDKNSKASVAIWRSIENKLDTISRGGNGFKNYAIDDKGTKVAFVAERDSSSKALQKFYKLWYWHNGYDSAKLLLDKNSAGMLLGWGISETGELSFSKSGKRLFLGTAPIQPPRDTTLIEADLVKVDIWHYKDDYLQPQQLRNLDRELKRNYTGMYELATDKYLQLADKNIPQVIITNEGDGGQFTGITDVGKRVSLQWEGETKKDIYAIDAVTGERKLVKKDLSGFASVSPMGEYIIWYDNKARNYFTWKDGVTKNISSKIPVKLYNEDFDMPDDPNPYGIMGWYENDAAVFLYDKYDIWRVNMSDNSIPKNITGYGRKASVTFRHIQLDPEKRFFNADAILARKFSHKTKESLLEFVLTGGGTSYIDMENKNFSIGQVAASGRKVNILQPALIYTKESYTRPPDLYVAFQIQPDDESSYGTQRNYRVYEIQLSSINPQQKNYNWGTAELFKWKAYDGKDATGIVYKPEDYDPKKKYPLICYFYEKLSDGLHQYLPPSPTPSRLNIPFFVSRGYIVLAPDIVYSKGYPGKSAYNYIVSGARALVKKGWVDSTRIGLQGQSWGGYQVAHLITRTNLFKAAWAGAPVANMTSAYGGIRWESGLNRQFQYEKSQSRIGATLWEKPQLFIENSPLFHLPKVNTALVIMANDADGAVPWYQGIELFTGLRRLGKKVWMLNYNGEAHNLVERKNRKDIQVREQQFFDWLLKGDKPARWLEEGVPAADKGKDWGLGK